MSLSRISIILHSPFLSERKQCHLFEMEIKKIWDIFAKFPPVLVFHFCSIPPNSWRTNCPRNESAFISGKLTAYQGQYKQKWHKLVFQKASSCMCMSQIPRNFWILTERCGALVAKQTNLLSMNVCITDSRNSQTHLSVHLLRTPGALLKLLASDNSRSQIGEISVWFQLKRNLLRTFRSRIL